MRRKLLGLTQPELAERLGASRGNSGYISEIEHGKRDFGVSLLGKLADALECSASDFFSNQLVKNNKLADLETLEQAHAHAHETAPLEVTV